MITLKFYRTSFTEIFLKVLLLISSSTYLVGCGGSGENVIDDGPDSTIIIDNTPPTLTLNGAQSITVLLGSEYIDAGATAVDNIDGDISSQIVITHNVNIEVIGNYTYTYNVMDASNNQAQELVRQVRVVASDSGFTFFASKNVITIGENMGGFTGDLDSGDRFARDHAPIGDVNGDGINDLIIGARSDDDGAEDAGAVYILMMNAQGEVSDSQKISSLEGNFTETLLANNFFGYGVAGIGDIDMDGIPDVAVTAPTQVNQAIFIIHLNADGTAKNWRKIDGINGQGLSSIGDIDGDGIIDLIAANPQSDDGGRNRGAIQLLFLNQDSTLREVITISSTQGGFGEGLSNDDQFGGRESAFLGDIDGDGTVEIAVGAFMSDGGRGAIWILSLDSQTYMVTSKVKIASNQGGFNEEISDAINTNGSSGGQFGHALAAVGDINGDGVVDLISAANQYNEGYAYLFVFEFR